MTEPTPRFARFAADFGGDGAAGTSRAAQCWVLAIPVPNWARRIQRIGGGGQAH